MQIVCTRKQLLQKSMERDSKVVKPKQKKKPPMIKELLVSDDEVKRKTNIFENELYNIIIGNKINLLKVCITAFFSPWETQSKSSMPPSLP